MAVLIGLFLLLSTCRPSATAWRDWPTVGQCPAGCACSVIAYFNTCKVDCRGRGMLNVPEGIPADTNALHLDHNQITNLSPNTFSGLGRLRRLRLDNNNITNISPNTFSGLGRLRYLYLDHNQITNIPSNTFSGLWGLSELYLENNHIHDIPSNTFSDLRYLWKLWLQNNNIRYLPNGTFTPLQSIREIYLRGNPLMCDCNLKWLAEYMQHHINLLHDEPTCGGPKQLQRRNLQLLDPSSFTCQGQCPEGCMCPSWRFFKVVNCPGIGMENVPEGIPTDTRELYLINNTITDISGNDFSGLGSLNELHLEHNQITNIPSNTFSGLRSLLQLHLDHNQITNIPSNTFSGLGRLWFLQLGNNRITNIPSNTFSGLRGLWVLVLQNNNIQYLANGTFTPLQRISRIGLDGNPLMCDCNMKWLAEYMQHHNNIVNDSPAPQCGGPIPLQHRNLDLLDPSDFTCQVMTTSVVLDV